MRASENMCEQERVSQRKKKGKEQVRVCQSELGDERPRDAEQKSERDNKIELESKR